MPERTETTLHSWTIEVVDPQDFERTGKPWPADFPASFKLDAKTGVTSAPPIDGMAAASEVGKYFTGYTSVQ